MRNFDNFLVWYGSCFSSKTGSAIGNEKERIVIDNRTLKMADCSKLFQKIEGFAPIYDDVNRDLVVGFNLLDGNMITSNAGKGTIKMISGPGESLHIQYAKCNEILKNVLSILPENFSMLSLGIQPKAIPSWKMWVDKGRHQVMREATNGRTVESCRIATDKTKISLELAEAIKIINTLNASSGFEIFIMGNSAIYNSKKNGCMARREYIWDQFGDDYSDRTGMLPYLGRPFFDFADYVNYLFNLKVLFYKNLEGDWIIPNKTFQEIYKKEEDFEEIKNIWKYHEENFWANNRLRVMGTVENRLCCPQPISEFMAVDAMNVGIVANYEEISYFLRKFSWGELINFRKSAILHGLNSSLAGFTSDRTLASVRVFLNLVYKGLKKRKLAEEVFLDNTMERIFARNPWTWAQKSIENYNKGGIYKVVDGAII